ncbi:MAG: 50S ribosomal protein L6 [Nitrosomonas sp.]
MANFCALLLNFGDKLMSTICYSAKPIEYSSNIQVELSGDIVKVSGPLGKLDQTFNMDCISIEFDGLIVRLHAINNSQHARAMLGTVRALIVNMIKGVSLGFERKLLLIGVGYRAQLSGRSINLNLGFSHPVVYDLPDGVDAVVTIPTEIVIKGIDKQKVGQASAELRFFRKPEPYKGKGIRYSDEVILLKETKKK